eukprot:8675459-Pyramimonas_sp.AAC.1
MWGSTSLHFASRIGRSVATLRGVSHRDVHLLDPIVLGREGKRELVLQFAMPASNVLSEENKLIGELGTAFQTALRRWAK